MKKNIYYPVLSCISAANIPKVFKMKSYVLAEDTMAAKIAEVINLFSVSDNKISMGEQSTLSV